MSKSHVLRSELKAEKKRLYKKRASLRIAKMSRLSDNKSAIVSLKLLNRTFNNLQSAMWATKVNEGEKVIDSSDDESDKHEIDSSKSEGSKIDPFNIAQEITHNQDDTSPKLMMHHLDEDNTFLSTRKIKRKRLKSHSSGKKDMRLKQVYFPHNDTPMIGKDLPPIQEQIAEEQITERIELKHTLTPNFNNKKL